MKIIDLNNWSRAEHYLFFKRMDYPHYHIGANLDITNYLPKIKAQGLAFSFSMTYAVSLVMNEVEAFRYRIHGEQVVLHDKIHPSFSCLAPDSEYFKMVTANMTESVEGFVKQAREKALKQEKSFVLEDVEGRDDLIYIQPSLGFLYTFIPYNLV